jgi:hypothetical protein
MQGSPHGGHPIPLILHVLAEPTTVSPFFFFSFLFPSPGCGQAERRWRSDKNKRRKRRREALFPSSCRKTPQFSKCCVTRRHLIPQYKRSTIAVLVLKRGVNVEA